MIFKPKLQRGIKEILARKLFKTSDFQKLSYMLGVDKLDVGCVKTIIFLFNIGIPNYELFDDIDTAYENFIQKVMAVIDNLAPSKNKRIKGTSQNWFDVEIMEKIRDRDSLLDRNVKIDRIA